LGSGARDLLDSRRFPTEVLGGRVVFGPEPTNIELANSFIVINGGGGPTDDKPAITLETPRDPDRVSTFLTIRVEDIHAVYAELTARGAQFLTPPKQHQYEIRCYIRDPDGSIIELGQTTDPNGDWWPADWKAKSSSAETGLRLLLHVVRSQSVVSARMVETTFLARRNRGGTPARCPNSLSADCRSIDWDPRMGTKEFCPG
jgi:hypothetical protein